MREPRREIQEQQLEAFKSEFVNRVIKGEQAESFTGVPEDVRPSLSLEGKTSQEQLARLLQHFVEYMLEVLRTNEDGLKIPTRYQDLDEQNGTTYTRFRSQLAKDHPDDNGWIPQLWISEVAPIEDAPGEENPDRVDRRLNGRLATAVERLKRLSEKNVPQAAQEEKQLWREIIASSTTYFEDTRITFQLYNSREKQVRSLIGVRMMRCLAGYQAWPVFIVGGKREIYDSEAPLVPSSQHSETPFNDWASTQEFNNSTTGQVLKGLVDKILNIR